MRCSQPILHVGEEGLHRRLDAGLAIRGPHGVKLFLARLLHHIQSRSLRLGQGYDRARNDSPEQPRALAAAGDQDVDRTSVAQLRIRRFAHSLDGIAHRVSDDAFGRLSARRQAVETIEAAGDELCAFGKEPVHAAKHRVLLVNDDRQAHRPRG